MFAINNYSVVAKSLTEVVLFSSAMMEKLESLGCAEDGIIKVSSALEMELSDEDKAVAQSHLQHIVATGLTLNGVTYVPFFAGSSDIRKGASAWIREDLHAEIGKWTMCGLSTKDMKIAVNKYAAYIGLLMSSTRTFMQVYGRKLSVRRVCVVKDSYITVSSSADFVQGTNVTRKDEHTVEINAFDGAAYIRPEVTGGKASTLRAPWVKAMAIPMDFIGYAEEHGLSTVIKDYWGNDVDLRDIDLILTESCIEAAGSVNSGRHGSWCGHVGPVSGLDGVDVVRPVVALHLLVGILNCALFLVQVTLSELHAGVEGRGGRGQGEQGVPNEFEHGIPPFLHSNGARACEGRSLK